MHASFPSSHKALVLPCSPSFSAWLAFHNSRRWKRLAVAAKKNPPTAPPQDKPAAQIPLQKWFSTDGRSLKAQWLRQEGEIVTLKLENSRIVQIPISSLSPQSQTAARQSVRFGGREPVYNWTFFAGNFSKRGSTDGKVSEAMFNHPGGMVFDSAGNLFVADVENNTIRKITPDGDVSTFAGKAGVSGLIDGDVNVARFHHPCGLAIDANGSLLVVESVNATLRKITPEGIVTKVAGSNGKRVSYGHEDGRGGEARFFFPWGVAIEPSGNIFVTDTSNGTIRKVTEDGLVTTFAGKARDKVFFADGKGDQARFANPHGLVIDAEGNLYVADSANAIIRKISPTGEVSTFAGKAGEPGKADGLLSEARFSTPGGIAMDSAGNFFIADRDNCTIRKISASGRVSTIGGMPGAVGKKEGVGNNARFVHPHQIAVDAEGRIYLDDLDLRIIYRGVPQ